MAENIFIWPPRRTRPQLQPIDNIVNELQSNHAVPEILSIPRTTASNTDQNPLSLAGRKLWQNGYEKAPKAPSFEPYAMPKRGSLKHAGLFVEADPFMLKPLPPLSVPQWNALTQDFMVLPPGATLRTFQMQGPNLVLAREKDLLIISPTGSGKSKVWSLALHAQKKGISIVVTPYTSLGKEGASRCVI